MTWLMLGSLAGACLTLVLSVTPVNAKDYEYAISFCASGTTTVLSTTEEMTVLSYDVKGITWSTHPTNKAFDKSTYHCVGIVRTGRAGLATHGYCKYMEPDGDFVVGEAMASGPEGQWQFLEGTGKYKGIKGGGPNQPFVSGKPIVPGTSQNCRSATGKYTLPN
jgi:hypothetical protein